MVPKRPADRPDGEVAAAVRAVPTEHTLLPYCDRVVVDFFKPTTLKSQRSSNGGSFELVYFLSHYHSDHYQGISRTWNLGPILCSPSTAALLTHILHVEPRYIWPLPFDQSHFINLNAKSISPESLFVDPPTAKRRLANREDTGVLEVRLMDATHCPGAACFLFLGNSRSYPSTHPPPPRSAFFATTLKPAPTPSPPVPKRWCAMHTGDFRYSPDVHDSWPGWYEDWDLEKPRLFVDALYLDTTYAHPRHDFPSQDEICTVVADAVAQRICEDAQTGDRTLFIVATYTIGKELLLSHIACTTNLPICVATRKLATLSLLSLPYLPSDVLTTDPTVTPVHVVPWGVVGQMAPGGWKFCADWGYLADFVEAENKKLRGGAGGGGTAGREQKGDSEMGEGDGIGGDAQEGEGDGDECGAVVDLENGDGAETETEENDGNGLHASTACDVQSPAPPAKRRRIMDSDSEEEVVRETPPRKTNARGGSPGPSTLNAAGTSALTVEPPSPTGDSTPVPTLTLAPVSNPATASATASATSPKPYTRVLAIIPTGWSHTFSQTLSTSPFHIDAKNRPGTTDAWLAVMQVPYSEHSSYTELRAFVGGVKPARVVPTVFSAGKGADREKVEKVKNGVVARFLDLLAAEKSTVVEVEDDTATETVGQPHDTTSYGGYGAAWDVNVGVDADVDVEANAQADLGMDDELTTVRSPDPNPRVVDLTSDVEVDARPTCSSTQVADSQTQWARTLSPKPKAKPKVLDWGKAAKTSPKKPTGPKKVTPCGVSKPKTTKTSTVAKSPGKSPGKSGNAAKGMKPDRKQPTLDKMWGKAG